MSREKTLLILGASARAAAFSALAAGLEPVCGDAFADADLRRVCQASAAASYPTGLVEIARAAPPAPWMYTGALENQPRLIARISERRLLLGNGPRVLADVRDPFAIARALGAAGLRAPAVARSSAEIPRDGSWLRKPLDSSGGTGIVLWSQASDPRAMSRKALKPRHYFQERIAGVSCSAIYVAAGGRSKLLGATEQLLTTRTPDATGPAFHYAGSVGPLQLAAATADCLRHIGEVLTRTFGLVGLFGVDYVDDGRDLWPVEVNPRFTASVEILEHALGFSAVGLHTAACLERQLRDAQTAYAMNGPAPRWHAKRILYARRHGMVDHETARALLATAANGAAPSIADIPRAGAELLPGRPILTLFGHGPSREAALAEIDCKRAALANTLPI